MSWWPFRSPSPRDEYPPEPKPLVEKKTYQVNGGELVKQKVHVCDTPRKVDLEVEGYAHVDLELGDVWTCGDCNAAYYWWGETWQSVEPPRDLKQ